MEDKQRSLYCGNLSDKVTEDLLYELFLQAGPLESVTIPKDKDGRPRNFGFIAFKHEVSVPYAIALMNGVSLFGKPLRLDARSSSAEENPYLQQLQQYMFNTQRFQSQYDGHQQGYNRYQQNDNRFHQSDSRQQNDTKYHDSRRNQSRTDSQMSGNNSSGIYMNYAPMHFVPILPQIPLPPVNMYPYSPSPGRMDHRHSRSNYRY